MKKVFSKANCHLDGRMHVIQYGINPAGSTCIRIIDINGYTVHKNGNTKEVLRKIIRQANLQVSELDSSGYLKNTHLLGQHTIKALN
ncbi:MAG TPA: hypothetical protein PLP23_13750 [Panacibacter sp.]|nr:hypothetical protein [Panacibacter sp.]